MDWRKIWNVVLIAIMLVGMATVAAICLSLLLSRPFLVFQPGERVRTLYDLAMFDQNEKVIILVPFHEEVEILQGRDGRYKIKYEVGDQATLEGWVKKQGLERSQSDR